MVKNIVKKWFRGRKTKTWLINGVEYYPCHCYLLHLFLIADNSNTSLFVPQLPKIIKLREKYKVYYFSCFTFLWMPIKVSCIACDIVNCLATQ